MERKLISGLGALLCLIALPWSGQTASRAGAIEVPPAGGISPNVLRLAVSAVQCATSRGTIARPPTLTVIDYSRPSVEPRLWVFDLNARGKLVFKELVAHGRNTGGNMATQFSDAMNSRQSSLGLFVASDTYVGSNGYSLRLDGLEPGFNARARARAIVMHGAPYVDPSLGAAQGRIGRSWDARRSATRLRGPSSTRFEAAARSSPITPTRTGCRPRDS